MDRKHSLTRLPWLPPLLFCFLFTVITWPSWLTLADRWLKFDESYSHGFLILAVSLFLGITTWRRERPIAGFYWFWVIPLSGAALLYAVGNVLLVNTFEQLALIPLLISGLLVIWGWRQTVPFFIPIGLMIFTLPLWDYLSWPLQLITVAFNHFMLSWFDIDFVVEGVFVYFPGVGAFEIAHGCSGLRYLLVGMTLALLYGELNLKAVRSRVLLFASAVLLSLVANWIRVLTIIYMGYETNMTSSLVEDHDMFGWWVFAATLVPVFFIARRLELQEMSSEKSKRPSVNQDPTDSAGSNKPLLGTSTALLPVVAVGLVSWLTTQPAASFDRTGSSEHFAVLVDSNHWLPLFEQTLDGWQPDMQRPDKLLERAFLNRKFLNEESRADERLFVALYTYNFQRPGREVVYYSNRLYDDSFHAPERTFNISTEGSFPMGGLTLRSRQSDQLIHLAYGYYIEGRWETNELQAKLAQLPGLLNSRTDASLLVIGLSCSGCAPVERLEELAPSIQAQALNYLDDAYGRNN